MRPTVARQFVATRKAPLTILPITDVGLFACVPSQVRLQVAAFQVGLVAAGVWAHKDALLASEKRLGGWLVELMVLLLFKMLLDKLARG